MRLTTEVAIPAFNFELNHHHKLLSIGSCFSENIGKKLTEDGFSIDVNPFGILFDSASIRRSLSSEFAFRVDHVVKKSDQFVHLDAHSMIHKPSKTELLKQLESIRKGVQSNLKSLDVLIVTLGTAWVYRRIETESLIANCHKEKADLFQKELLNLEEETKGWQKLIDQLLSNNPHLKILMTVSPVRHEKNGLWQNNVSKGLLHQLMHELVSDFENVSYFPAYELVMDELRDYRFFESDLLHPNQLAISYIYEKFGDCLFNPKTKELCKLRLKIRSAKQHRFIQPTADEISRHEQYIQNLEKEFESKLKS